MKRFPRSFLLDALAGLARGGFDALAAFDAPPTHETARRYRAGALVGFLVASGLLLAAALFETVLGSRRLSEAFGWLGLAVLGSSLVCGFAHAAVNKFPDHGDQDFS